MARDLLRRYSRLAHRESTGSSAEVVEQALETVLGVDLPRDLDAGVRALRERLGARPRAWSLVPSHGDITLTNLIADRTGNYLLIDFEDARDLPYFYDPCSLLIQDDQLWRAALAGEFDAEMEALRIAARDPELMDLRVAAQTCAVIAAAAHFSAYGGDVAFALRRVWRS